LCNLIFCRTSAIFGYPHPDVEALLTVMRGVRRNPLNYLERLLEPVVSYLIFLGR
jgi:hypothetical protein